METELIKTFDKNDNVKYAVSFIDGINRATINCPDYFAAEALIEAFENFAIDATFS